MCDACGTGGVVADSVGCAVRDMRDLCVPHLPLSDASHEVRDFVVAAGVVVPSMDPWAVSGVPCPKECSGCPNARLAVCHYRWRAQSYRWQM